MSLIDSFAHQNYLSIETFRRNGTGVQTPVWFAQDGALLYVVTLASSGKVKRIRRSARVNVVPCRMNGRPVGSWVPAQAREISDPEMRAKVNRLFDRKYGLLRKLSGLRRATRGAQDTVLEIRLVE